MKGLMSREETNRILVEDAKAGDRAAFDRLAVTYQDRLRSLAQSRIRVHGVQGVTDAPDVAQETLTRAFERIHRFQWKGEDSFYKWLRGIAERVILEAVRRQHRDPVLKLSDMPARAPSPSHDMRRHERFDRLKDALGQLSPDYRKVIELSRFDGLSIKRIAGEMNRTPDAVKKLLSRALKQMKHLFGDTESLSLPQRMFEERGSDDVGE